jgi:mono/diheme cytochrome c family protein
MTSVPTWLSRWLRVAGALMAVVVIGLGGGVVWRLSDRDSEVTMPDRQPTPELIARGEYLTKAADCAACHTVPGGATFGGGLSFKLPFGTIYSTNITSDRETGIGTWSDDDFVRALHQGIAKDGTHLYPAFPYTSYTGMTRDDAIAIKAYLFSLAPARAPAHANDLSFPFNQRWTLAFWNLAFLHAQRFHDDSKLSAQENRGFYLATALGHCGECHTPRNVGFAMKESAQFSGTIVNGWYAYDITADKRSGIGSWSDGQLVEYLRTGHADGHGSATGPMGEAVANSLQHLSPEDLKAIVAYLRAVKPIPEGDGVEDPVLGKDDRRSAVAEDALGHKIFVANCMGCHLMNGEGRQTPYATLLGSHAVRDPRGTNLIEVLLSGADAGAVHPLVAMPRFEGGFSNDELAALVNFTIGHFGGQPGRVTAADVKKARSNHAE